MHRRELNEKLEGKVEILGHKVKLENIQNPHIIAAIKERADNFLFNYRDGACYKEYHDKYDDWGAKREWKKIEKIEKRMKKHHHDHSDDYYDW